jgi:hypothetical protein
MNVLVLRSGHFRISKDEASWFETAQERLLIMRSGTVGRTQKEGPHQAGLRTNATQLTENSDQAVLL